MSFNLTFDHFGNFSNRFLQNSYYIDLSWEHIDLLEGSATLGLPVGEPNGLFDINLMG